MYPMFSPSGNNTFDFNELESNGIKFLWDINICIGMSTTVRGFNFNSNFEANALPGIAKMDLSFVDIYSQDLKDDIKARRKFRKIIVNKRFGNARRFCKYVNMIQNNMYTI